MSTSTSSIQYNAHLHAAIAQQDCEWAKMALQFGADPNCMDEDGNTPLHLLLNIPEDCEMAEEFVQILMQAGASLSLKNKKGLNPLELAEECDRWDLALRLATYKIDAQPAV